MASVVVAERRHRLAARRWPAVVGTALVGGPARDAGWLVPLLALFLAKQLLLVGILAPFMGHDEVDHFYYVARLADGKGLGVVGEVKLPKTAEPYRNYVADYPFNAEVIQPPLYHALLAPLYAILPGGTRVKLYALRLVSVALGALVVWLAYRVALLLFPGEPAIRAGVPIFVALQPQFSFEAAIVNHDVLLIALYSALLLLLLRGLRDGFGRRDTLAVGAIAAAGLWTKVSFGLALPVIAAALLLAWWDHRRSVASLGVDALVACVVPLLMAVPWFARSYHLYGDPSGAERLRNIYGDQASTYSEMLWSAGFWRDRLQDFWGNYGWRRIPFEPVDYNVIWLVWSIAGLGVIALIGQAGVRRLRRRRLLTRFQARALLLIALSLTLLVFGVLYVGTIQFTQSRFVFPGMIGFGLLTTLGYAAWLPPRVRPFLLPILAIALVVMNALEALRIVLPYFAGPGGSAVGQ